MPILALPTAAPLALALAMTLLGAAAAVGVRSVTKRVIALFVAMTGAVLAAAALKAFQPEVLLAGLSVAAAQMLLGVALIVRLHEAHGVSDLREIDALEARQEPPEPGA